MTTTLEYTKDTRRNRDTKDWDAYVVVAGKAEYLGSRRTQGAAEILCDQYVSELLRQQTRRAA